MFIIKIDDKLNKLQSVYSILNELISNFKNYKFINNTQSPLDVFTYEKSNNIFCRHINEQNNIKIVAEDFVKSYYSDKLEKQGVTLDEYIDMCYLYELDRIDMISEEQQVLATILVCPDGFDEIQILCTRFCPTSVTQRLESFAQNKSDNKF